MSPEEKASGDLTSPENISPKRKKVLNAVDDGIPLVILGLALFFSTRFIPITENEALTLKAASQPFRMLLSQFRDGLGFSDAPSLYVLWLHLWLVLSDGVLALLRAPQALFFVGGVWLLSRATRFWGGNQSANGLLWLAVFWPYAFHYGSQASGYPLTFFLIAALISAYVKFCEEPDATWWTAVLVLAVVLVYVSFFGWALLILLGADYKLLNRQQSGSAGVGLLTTAAGVAIAYAPFWPSTLAELWRGLRAHPPARTLVLNAAYNFYVLVASESVAPWFWRFGVPVAVAIAIAVVLCWVSLGWGLRRFMIFGGLLIASMDLVGALRSDRLLLAAPLFLVPVAVALCTTENLYLRRALAGALAIAVGVGWYGVYARRYYATARFAEPWPSLAAETAGAIQQGGGLITNSPSLFLYLTYDLAAPASAKSSAAGFSGFLPDTVRNPQVWSADGWKRAGQPMQPYMIWINAVSSPSSGSQPMAEAAKSLDSRCSGGRVERYLVPEPAYDWKNRLFPQLSATPWRIEIGQYLCGESPTAPPTTSAPPKPTGPATGPSIGPTH